MSHGQALQSDLGFNVQAGMWKARDSLVSDTVMQITVQACSVIQNWTWILILLPQLVALSFFFLC